MNPNRLKFVLKIFDNLKLSNKTESRRISMLSFAHEYATNTKLKYYLKNGVRVFFYE